MRRSTQSIRNTRDTARTDDSVATGDAFLRPAAAAEFLQVTKGYLAKLRMAVRTTLIAWVLPVVGAPAVVWKARGREPLG